MFISWKSLVLIAFGLMTTQYTIINLLAPPEHCLCPAHSKLGIEEQLTNPRQTHVLILTSTRCGSSFLGELLNQHPDVFYLLEPLYHIQDSLTGNSNFIREVIAGASRDLLWSLFQCDLHALERYLRPPPSNHMVDSLFFWGSSRALCRTPVCKPTNPDKWAEGQCGQCSPINLTRAGEFCSTRSHVAYKTVRIVVVDNLRPLLEDPRLNIKVIQLVRDPRGILNSRIDIFSGWYKAWHTWKTTGQRPESLDIHPPQFNSTCEELYGSVTTALSKPEWLRDRYMLLRYEDLARFPHQKTKEIYDFVGLNMTSSVEKWISDHTGSSIDSKNKPSTKQDSAAIASSWRRKLPIDIVKQAQKECHHYMRLLGYRQVQTQEDLLNMNISLVEDTFLEPYL
ncbi:unnamed protein product [Knipowitschia caucasica]|uniref:Sulfotransferase n=1 Tax=Knipowitschia caucasica TaxID=637954 RepID=A0AAV2LTP3_KNICA